MIAIDREERITFFNAAAERQYGVKADDVLGCKLAEIYSRHWPSPEAEAATWSALREHGEWRGDTVERLHDGRELHVESSMTMLRGADGADAGMVSAIRDITARKLAEEQLRASEERLRRVHSQSPAGIVETDATGRMTMVNARWCEMLGYTEAELLQMAVLDITHEGSRAPTMEAVGRLAAGGPDFRIEKNYLRKDGTALAAHSSVSAVRTPDGEFLGLVAVVMDVTERNHAEATLRASEERLALGTEVAGLGLAEVDYTTGLIHLTARAARLFGLGEAAVALPRAEVHATFHPEDRKELERRIAQCLDPASRGELAMEHRVVWPGGEVRWLSVRKQVFFTGEGAARRPARAVLAALDVTAEKNAAEAVRENEARMRLATEATAVGIWEWNILTHAIHWDAQMFRLYGIAPTADGFVHYSDWTGAVLPEELAENERILQDTVRRGGQSRREFRIRRREDGEVRHIEAVETVRTNEHGQVEWMVGTNLDITERKRAEQSLRKAAEEIARASRAKDDFLAALSHELRTPLTPVLMTTTALASDPTLSPEVRDQLAMMQRNVELEARLIDDLLDLTRISRGKLTIATQAADLHQLLQHTADIVRSDTFATQVSVTFALEAARHHALVDPTRIQQVFWNLIKNALKFTPTGGSITVSTRNDAEGWLIVSVADNGIGISAEALPHIFRAFEQGDVAGVHRYGASASGSRFRTRSWRPTAVPSASRAPASAAVRASP